jgi:hypothetical protein
VFAKIFNQIYDSSIVESPETRFTFMDFLVLADPNGIVDMTQEAIARRTNRPVEVIRKTILELEGPDPRSRTPLENGARIYRLDDHRDWGWAIVNYDYFRRIASEEQRREKTKLRTQKWRKRRESSPPVTHRDAPKRIGDDSPSASASASASFLDDLKKDPFNAGVDIDRELELAKRWCKKKGRRCTQRFFTNWIQRADRIVPDPPKKPKPHQPPPPEPTKEEIEHRKAIASQALKQLRDKFKMP